MTKPRKLARRDKPIRPVREEAETEERADLKQRTPKARKLALAPNKDARRKPTDDEGNGTVTARAVVETVKFERQAGSSLAFDIKRLVEQRAMDDVAAAVSVLTLAGQSRDAILSLVIDVVEQVAGER